MANIFVSAGWGSGKTAILLASFARLLDLTGEYQRPPATDPATAMRADWNKVGDDLRSAMRESEQLLPADTEIPAELVEA